MTARGLSITKRKNTTKSFQGKAVAKLKAIFGDNMVIEEWDVAKNSQDGYTRDLYRPRIDVAIGPFNKTGNIEEDNCKINATINEYRDFITNLFENSETEVVSVDDFLYNINKNPRCFLAVEIEKSGTRKHLLGDIVNVSVIGAIGVVIPLEEDKLRGFKAIQKYIKFATNVGKLDAKFNNVLVVNRDNFINIISTFKHILQKKSNPKVGN